MSVFGWIAGLFRKEPPAAPWATDSGHRLRWAPGSLVSVYVDAALIEGDDVNPTGMVLDVVRKLRAAGVRVLLLPVSPTPETLASFDANQETTQDVVLIRATRIHPGALQSWRCSTDLRWDKRNGYLRCAEVDWLVAGLPVIDQANLVHELGHAMGLAHQDGTVMAPTHVSGALVRWSDMWFSYDQLRALVAEYGLRPA